MPPPVLSLSVWRLPVRCSFPQRLHALRVSFQSRRRPSLPTCASAAPSGVEFAGVTFAGAGPGDPALCTIATAAALASADAILYDDLGCQAVMDEHAAKDAQKVYVGKRGARDGATGATAQSAICEEIVRRALDGERVVRLKGGDPSTFGRLQDEIEACKANSLSWRVIAGVTSASAAAASLGVPLTAPRARRQVASLSVVSAHADVDWTSVSRGANTIAIYMGARKLESLARRLCAERGDSTPCMGVRRASSPDEARWVGTLAEAADGRMREALTDRKDDSQKNDSDLSPLLVVVGEAAKSDDDT